MQCAQCQQENPSQAKFCLEYGTRLIFMCVQCDTELLAGAKFCLECGQPVGGQPAPLSRFISPEALLRYSRLRAEGTGVWIATHRHVGAPAAVGRGSAGS